MEYFFSGFKLITQKGLKRFVFIPLLINIVLFGSSLFFLYGWLTDGFAYLNELLPTWLNPTVVIHVIQTRTTSGYLKRR